MIGGKVAEGVKWGIIFWSGQWPLRRVADAFTEAAGKKTSIDVSVSVTISIALTIAAGTQWARIRRQNAALKVLRERNEELKHDNDQLRDALVARREAD
ncbi:MAG: hypothetical protein Q7V57_11320 [Actinomycetota bacterium]|nr:hypothetical protein [Actinomycetota bacterium]